MIKDCMKKVITVNLHQTVKVQCVVHMLYCILHVGSVIGLAPFLPLKSTAFIHPKKNCSRNVGLLRWVNSENAQK